MTPDEEIVEANFNKFRNQNYPDRDPDEVFETFGTYLILKHHSIQVSRAADFVTDGAQDGGIDACCILLNGSEAIDEDSPRLSQKRSALSGIQQGVFVDIYCIQYKNQHRWDTAAFWKIWSTIKFLFENDKSEKELLAIPLSSSVVSFGMTFRKLRSKIASFAPKYRLHVLYMAKATKKGIARQQSAKASQVKKDLVRCLPHESEVDLRFIGVEDIVKLIRQRTDFTADLVFSKVPVREDHSFVGLVKIQDYIKFLSNKVSHAIREELFAVNVRDYAGNAVSVNSAIEKTLGEDSASSFWWLNNGITILADSANDPTELRWTLTNPQIVNGLQTSHIIYDQHVAERITRKRKKETILVRIIVQNDQSVRESIISGTNNQTSIQGLQLHANEEQQLRIEDFLKTKGWYYERRKYQYRGLNVPAGKICSVTKLAQAILAYALLEPDTARARPASFLRTKNGWNRVFSLGTSNTSPDETIFFSAILVLEKINKYLKTNDAINILDNPLNTRFYLVSGVGLYCSKVKRIEDYQHSLLGRQSSTIDDVELTKLLTLLYNEYLQLKETTDDSIDKIFKGKALKENYFKSILAFDEIRK